MAGVWERLVRSTKSFFRALLEKETKKLLTDEGIYTLLCEVENILNDRPITSNATGLDDAPALTPNMLLTFQRRTTPALDDYDTREGYAQRWWRHIQHLFNRFLKAIYCRVRFDPHRPIEMDASETYNQNRRRSSCCRHQLTES